MLDIVTNCALYIEHFTTEVTHGISAIELLITKIEKLQFL